jgi:hypothetical protein
MSVQFSARLYSASKGCLIQVHKQALLLATLADLAAEFERTIVRAVDAAGPRPGQQLLAMFEASLDPGITEPCKTAVRFAFSSEARSRADYQCNCIARDEKFLP